MDRRQHRFPVPHRAHRPWQRSHVNGHVLGLGDEPPVRTECDNLEDRLMAVEGEDFAVRCQIPYLGGSLGTQRHEGASIRAEASDVYGVAVLNWFTA